MAAAATITLTMALSGLRTGSRTVSPPEISVAGAVVEDRFERLEAGGNVIEIPTGATKVLIIPPTDNEIALGLVGAEGDTPIPIDPALPSLLCLGASPVLIINAAEAMSSAVELQFA